MIYNIRKNTDSDSVTKEGKCNSLNNCKTLWISHLLNKNCVIASSNNDCENK